MSGGVGSWRLLGRPERGKTIGPGFEIILGFSLLGVYMGYSDLSGLREGEVYTTASKLDYLLMALPGVYGLRVARFIAMARRYRMPQYIEWLVFIAPLIGIVVCAFASPHFVQGYAGRHDYRFCGPRPDHALVFVFAKDREHCPWVPVGKR